MLVHRRYVRDGCMACAVGAAVLFAALAALPADDGACTQMSTRWPQLNAWASQTLLRPFALLLQTC